MVILYNLFFAGLAAGIAAGCVVNPSSQFMGSKSQLSTSTSPATSNTATATATTFIATTSTATTATATTATATTFIATTSTATTSTATTSTATTSTATTATATASTATTTSTVTTSTATTSTVTRTTTRTVTVIITAVPSSTATYTSVYTTRTAPLNQTEAPQTTQYCLNGYGQADIPTWSNIDMIKLITNFCQSRQGLIFNTSSNYNQSISEELLIVLFTIDWNNWDLACQDKDVLQHVDENCTGIMQDIFNECSVGNMAGGYCYRGCLTYKLQKVT